MGVTEWSVFVAHPRAVCALTSLAVVLYVARFHGTKGFLVDVYSFTPRHDVNHVASMGNDGNVRLKNAQVDMAICRFSDFVSVLIHFSRSARYKISLVTSLTSQLRF